jgi:hypothetical protein
VEIYKLIHNLNTKEEAIKQMIRFFKVRIIPENRRKSEEYYKRALKFTEGLK